MLSSENLGQDPMVVETSDCPSMFQDLAEPRLEAAPQRQRGLRGY